MGLFGGKQTFVSSTVYNMAGPEEERTDYLKSVVVQNVIGNRNFSMARCMSESLIHGPAMQARHLYRWAMNDARAMVPRADIYVQAGLDLDQIELQIPRGSSEVVEIQDIRLDRRNYSYFAEQWIMDNHIARVGHAWTSSYDYTTGLITVNFPAVGATYPALTVSFPPSIPRDPSLPLRDQAMYYYILYVLKNTSTMYAQSKMFIYRVGSGNTVLDSIPVEEINARTFLPFIPVRVKNQFLSDTHHPELYDAAKDLYKKATGQTFASIVDKIADNEDLDEIDHAFVVYGVSLNCVDNDARKYLYEFFDFMRQAYPVTATDYQAGVTSYETYDSGFRTFRTQRGEWADEGGDDPVFAGRVPRYPADAIHLRRVRMRPPSGGPLDGTLDFEIEWRMIGESTGTGLKKPDARVGEVWLTKMASQPTGSGTVITPVSDALYDRTPESIIEINWQTGPDSWKSLVIKGLRHLNHVYEDHEVEITASEALDDTEESGFIVPLHYEAFRDMSLKTANQLMTAGCFIVFNSYKVVKKKWYQTGIFKIFVFVVIIAITVLTAGTGTAPAIGILGTAASVGAALGFVGIGALIVGAIANAIAAMIVMALLQRAATAVFGEKIGMIIAAVASLVAMNVGGALMSGQSMASAWGNLMSASNILGMTSAVGNGVAGYMQASAQQWAGKTEKLLEDYKTESQKYTDMYLEEFGYGRLAFDPLMLTDTGLSNFSETEAQFLSRTLMTGSDIAEMSLDMLTNFADFTLTLDGKGI